MLLEKMGGQIEYFLYNWVHYNNDFEDVVNASNNINLYPLLSILILIIIVIIIELLNHS